MGWNKTLRGMGEGEWGARERGQWDVEDRQLAGWSVHTAICLGALMSLVLHKDIFANVVCLTKINSSTQICTVCNIKIVNSVFIQRYTFYVKLHMTL